MCKNTTEAYFILKKLSLLQKSPVTETTFCKETCNFKESTNRSLVHCFILKKHFKRKCTKSKEAAARMRLRLVGSLKLQVSFAACSLFYRALLQKRPMILSGLLLGATPYEWIPNQPTLKRHLLTFKRKRGFLTVSF